MDQEKAERVKEVMDEYGVSEEDAVEMEDII